MKKLLTIAMITLAAMAAKADLYLYWTVDVGDDFKDAAYAALYSADNGIAAISIGDSARSNIGDYTEFLVKLYDSSAKEIAYSGTTYSYSDLTQFIWNSTSTVAAPASPYSFSGFVVPEPTSGLLLLLGLGALALKRKVS